MRRSTLHFWAGFAGLIVFALTGQYMQWELGRLEGMPDGPRMGYRSSHIFLLLASAMNLVRGIYSSRFQDGTLSGWLERFSTPLLLAAPVAYLGSFFVESHVGAGDRFLTFFGSVLVVAACVFLTGAAWFDRRK